MDAEVIRGIYGFNSTLGSHTSAKCDRANFDQAVFGLHMTENAVYFLLEDRRSSKKWNKLEMLGIKK